MQNKLLDQYNQRSDNAMFKNNPLLNNNEFYRNYYGNPQFRQKIQEAKMSRNIKSVRDLDMTNEELTNCIICPVKINKSSTNEVSEAYDNLANQYSSDKASGVVKEWWKERKNVPYKNILKDQDYSKEFKSQKDLIVHRISKRDKDEIEFMREYTKLKGLIETHNKDLKVIYSASEKTKHKKEFEYANKFKYKIKYNPKDFSQLKDFYAKEQNKITREKKKIDTLIDMLVEDEEISEKDLDFLNKGNESKDSPEKSVDKLDSVNKLMDRYKERRKDKETATKQPEPETKRIRVVKIAKKDKSSDEEVDIGEVGEDLKQRYRSRKAISGTR